MSNNKQSSVEWLISQLTEVERKNWINNKILCISKNSLAKQTFDAICEQAKEMEVAGREMSYDEGYAEGYKRALELIEWGIKQAKTK